MSQQVGKIFCTIFNSLIGAGRIFGKNNPSSKPQISDIQTTKLHEITHQKNHQSHAGWNGHAGGVGHRSRIFNKDCLHIWCYPYTWNCVFSSLMHGMAANTARPHNDSDITKVTYTAVLEYL